MFSENARLQIENSQQIKSSRIFSKSVLSADSFFAWIDLDLDNNHKCILLEGTIFQSTLESRVLAEIEKFKFSIISTPRKVAAIESVHRVGESTLTFHMLRWFSWANSF
jgi:hypothetical protein